MIASSSASGEHPFITFGRWGRRTLEAPDPDWPMFQLNFASQIGIITVSSNPRLIRVLLDQAREDRFRDAGVLRQLLSLAARQADLLRSGTVEGRGTPVDWTVIGCPGVTHITFRRWLLDELGIRL